MRASLATLLVVLVAAASACGQTGTRGGLPEESAQSLRAQLRDVEQAVQRGECEGIDAELLEVDEAIDDLPEGVDDRLQRRLSDGADRLREVAQRDCTRQNVETQPTETQTQPQETETQPEETETQPEETETQPEETQPEETETQPEETQPEETQPEETEPQETETEQEGGEGSGSGSGQGSGGGSGGESAGEESP